MEKVLRKTLVRLDGRGKQRWGLHSKRFNGVLHGQMTGEEGYMTLLKLLSLERNK